MNKYAPSDPEFVKKLLEVLYVDDLSTRDRNNIIIELSNISAVSAVKVKNVIGWL